MLLKGGDYAVDKGKITLSVLNQKKITTFLKSAK